MPRYLIGLDLGTTNSCVAYVDLDQAKNPSLGVQLFKIPQRNTEGSIESLNTLPSFCYLSDDQTEVGLYAKEQGAKVPTRAVQSAKSWLCNSAAARRERILPLQPARNDLQISPVEATAAYLRHIREQWNLSIGKGDPDLEFEAQELVLTVPASFDEVARHLTVEAARLAGYQNMTLLEEPQAAFYAWIGRHTDSWEEKLAPEDRVLVVDVGGGTTDFTLIDVVEGPSLRRMAVGRHLLLGGDNMDEALSHYLEKKLQVKLDSGQWHQLRHEARRAKERLLTGEVEVPIVLQGTGSSLLKGSLATKLTRDEALNLLLNGFFGSHTLQEARNLRKGSGIRAVGLPYEEEPSITKQLAAFLDGPPDWVLFNGGTMKPELFQNSILDSLESWFGKRPQLLESECLDLAVARGAAYFGKVRHGLGTRIEGGLPRTYYLGVVRGDQVEAVTLLERGTEEGTTVEPDKRFMLTPNQPVAFTLYTSQTRIGDKIGDLVEIDEEQLQSLPQLQTVLRYGKTKEPIPVTLKAVLTEIGTLELWLESVTSDHQWQLEFQLRSASGQDDQISQAAERQADETFEVGHLDGALKLLSGTFEGDLSPDQLMRKLEEELEQKRGSWSPSTLRALFDALIPLAEMRYRSAQHEARWWNRTGFCLRPGFGCPMDDFRIKELWKVILGDKQRSYKPESEIQRAVCIRRVAAGLNKGQQGQLFTELTKTESKNEMLNSEQLKAMAALEWVDLKKKKRIGSELAEKVSSGRGTGADLWSLARIGARRPLRGSVATVLPPETVEPWIEKLLPRWTGDQDDFAFCLQQLSQETEVRELNVREELRDRIGTAPQELRETEEQRFGERLPVGLTMEG